MQVQPIKTRIFREGEDLVAFITAHIPRLADGSILVVTSKIVALAEGRTATLRSKKDKENLIRTESDVAVKTKYVWLTIKDGMVMASAGVDESNAAGKVVLLPKDSYSSAVSLRRTLRRHYQIKKLGVLLTDSRTMPLRAGVTGVALGYAGFSGVRDYRGKPDLFKRKFKFSRTNVADGLAAAAVVEMGEGSERQPLAIITGASVVFRSKISKKETIIPLKDDMYLPFLVKLKKKNHG
jgi:coenzyme F420-0:L-glutamate ligase